MNTFVKKVTRIIHQLRGFLPERLPGGMTEFENFVTSLVETYDLPTNNLDDIRYVVGTAIMRLKETGAYKAKWYFVLILRAAAAKQISAAVFQDIKKRQQERAAAEASSNGTQM